jgi:hypothetical protein
MWLEAPAAATALAFLPVGKEKRRNFDKNTKNEVENQAGQAEEAATDPEQTETDPAHDIQHKNPKSVIGIRSRTAGAGTGVRGRAISAA